MASEFYNNQVGGAERVLHRLVRAMLDRGDSVTIVSFEKDPPFGIVSNGPGWTVYNFPPKGIYAPVNTAMKVIKPEVFKNQDAVFSQHFYHFSSFFAAQVSRQYKIPYVLKPIGIYEKLGFSRDIKYKAASLLLGGPVLKQASLIVPTTKFEADQLAVRVPEEHIRIIPVDIDALPAVSASEIEKFKAPYGDKKLIVCVGRIEYEKGSDILLKAIYNLVKNNVTNFHLLMIGDITKGFENYELGDMKPIKEFVTLVGPLNRQKLTTAYRAADFMVHPTRMDMIPLVIREAMSVGLPVIATRVGGILEFIEHDVSGYLVEPNSVGQLSAAMYHFLIHPETVSRLSKAALEAEQPIDYVQKTLDAIDSVVVKKPLVQTA